MNENPINPTPEQIARASAFATGLRAYADFIEAHPTFPMRYGDDLLNYVWAGSADDFAAAARLLAPVRKEGAATSSYMTIARDFGGGVVARVAFVKAGTCERVLVGKRTVKRSVPVVPASAEMKEIEVEEDVYEWRCPPILAANGEGE
jgi:hypothetical protein